MTWGREHFTVQQNSVLIQNGYIWENYHEGCPFTAHPAIFLSFLRKKAHTVVRNHSKYYMVQFQPGRTQPWDKPDATIQFPYNRDDIFFDEDTFQEYLNFCFEDKIVGVVPKFKDFKIREDLLDDDRLATEFLKTASVNNETILRLFGLRLDTPNAVGGYWFNSDLVSFYITWSHRKINPYNGRLFIFQPTQQWEKAIKCFYRDDEQDLDEKSGEQIVLMIWKTIHPASYFKFNKAFQMRKRFRSQN